jgi:hypothetical protein
MAPSMRWQRQIAVRGVAVTKTGQADGGVLMMTIVQGRIRLEG